jgi:hypothetical protein
MESVLLDVAGHRRPPATMPGYHRGRPPRNKGSCRRRHEPLFRGARPSWKLDRAAGERRRPRQSSNGTGSMTSSSGRWCTPRILVAPGASADIQPLGTGQRDGIPHGRVGRHTRQPARAPLISPGRDVAGAPLDSSPPRAHRVNSAPDRALRAATEQTIDFTGNRSPRRVSPPSPIR